MSFYVGKPYGRPICHITKGQHDVGPMRGAPFSDTVFHTDIKYVSFTTYDWISREFYEDPYADNAQTSDAWYYKFSDAAFSLLGQGYAYALWDKVKDEIYFTSPGWTFGEYNIWKYKIVDNITGVETTYALGAAIEASTNRHGEQISYWDGSAYRAGTLKLDSTICDFDEILVDPQLIIFNFKFNGQITYEPLTENDVEIDRTKFKVSGKNILTNKYLNNVKINTIDHYGAYPFTVFANNVVDVLPDDDALEAELKGNVQFINSVTPSSGCEIISNDTVTKIKAGGKTIITSEFGAQKVQMGRIQHIPSASWYIDGSANSSTPAYGPIGGPFSDDELVYIGLRMPYADANGDLRQHDIQRFVKWKNYSTDVKIAVEIRLYSWLYLVMRNGYLYISIDQIIVDGWIIDAECTTVVLR